MITLLLDLISWALPFGLFFIALPVVAWRTAWTTAEWLTNKILNG